MKNARIKQIVVVFHLLIFLYFPLLYQRELHSLFLYFGEVLGEETTFFFSLLSIHLTNYKNLTYVETRGYQKIHIGWILMDFKFHRQYFEFLKVKKNMKKIMIFNVYSKTHSKIHEIKKLSLQIQVYNQFWVAIIDLSIESISFYIMVYLRRILKLLKLLFVV